MLLAVPAAVVLLVRVGVALSLSLSSVLLSSDLASERGLGLPHPRRQAFWKGPPPARSSSSLQFLGLYVPSQGQRRRRRGEVRQGVQEKAPAGAEPREGDAAEARADRGHGRPDEGLISSRRGGMGVRGGCEEDDEEERLQENEEK